MDLNQIRYFLALARTLNFTRAAELCNVTQPSLSRGIQRLEAELGGALVLRERSLTQLTEFGRTMLPLLQQAFDAAEAARSRAEQRRRAEDSAALRLGLAPFVPLAPLLPALAEVTRRVEGTLLRLHLAEAEALAEALLAGALDLVVLPEAARLPDRVNRWRLWSAPLRLLLPPGHPLAGEGPLDSAALATVAAPGPLILPGGGGGAMAGAVREALRAALGPSAAVEADPPHGADDAEQAAALVALGLGLALVPDGVAIPAAPPTTSRPLSGPAVPMALAAVAGRPMNRAVGALQKLLRARRWEAAG